MGTAVTYDKNRLDAIERSNIVSGGVVGDNLVLYKKDGTALTAGNVRGAAGPAGPGFLRTTVDNVKFPLIISHRGGANIFPEESMEGLKWSYESGFAIEVDVYMNASGSLICIHDATVDRTMTGITGAVSAVTDAQWRSARIKSPVKGGPSAAPVFFTDVLDRFGGRAMIVPEVKTYDDATVSAFIQAIVDRGLEKAVIVQSFDWATAQRFAARGLATIFLCGNTTTYTPQNLIDSGIYALGPGLAMSQATVQSFRTAGVHVFGYTVNTPSEQEIAFGKGMDGIFSNDPWFTSRRIQTSGNMPIEDPAKGALWPGARFLQPSGASGAFTPSPEPIYLGYGGVGVHTVPASTPQTRFLECPWAELVGPSFTAVLRGNFGTDYSGSLGDTIGGVLWRNTSDADSGWEDAAKTGQNGYTWVVRRNGQIAVWKYTNGAAASLLVSSTAGAQVSDYIAPNNNLGEFVLVLQHFGSSLRLSLTDSNRALPTSITATDTNSNPVALKFGIRFLASGFIQDASVNVT